MINVSKSFKRKLYQEHVPFINSAEITLADGTELGEITNERIMSSGLELEDAVGDDNSFNVLGSTVINSATLTLYNNDEVYSDYDFVNADVVIYTGLYVDAVIDGESTTILEKIKKGTFTVDDATFGESTITLTMLDYMEQFDRPYNLTTSSSASKLQYPATLGEIVRDACSKCGVTLATDSLNFPHNEFTIPTRPTDDDTTFREIIGYCATLAGCYATCNPDGKLELNWYNTEALEDDTGKDGGIFDSTGTAINPFPWILNYINTETDMNVLLNTRADDSWYHIDNSTNFKFNRQNSLYIYICSNSYVRFVNSSPGTTPGTTSDGINICSRDGQAILIKYQEIINGDDKAVKIKFHGYTRYQQSTQLPEYEIEYELFIINNEAIVINFIKLPTNSDYLGRLDIREGTTITDIPRNLDNLIVMVRQEDYTWETLLCDKTASYITGDNVYGGIFNPWDVGDIVDGETFNTEIIPHYITSLYSQDMGVDDVVITGVRISIKVEDPESDDDIKNYLAGTDDYVIEITDNPFITELNAATILDWLSAQLIGLRFRKCNVTHISDPTIEAGDVALVWDTKGEEHPILISRVTFSPVSPQTIVCGAQTPSRNNAARFSEQTKNYVKLRKQLREQRDSYQEALDELADEVANASGLYYTEVEQPDHSIKTYYHNKPELAESDIQILISNVGITVTSNGTDPHPTWYGLTVNGELLASVITTMDLFFNYAHGGVLTLGGVNNGNGRLRVLDSNDNDVATMDNTGLSIIGTTLKTSMGQVKIPVYKNIDDFIGRTVEAFINYAYDNSVLKTIQAMGGNGANYPPQYTVCTAHNYFNRVTSVINDSSADLTDIDSYLSASSSRHYVEYFGSTNYSFSMYAGGTTNARRKFNFNLGPDAIDIFARDIDGELFISDTLIRITTNTNYGFIFHRFTSGFNYFVIGIDNNANESLTDMNGFLAYKGNKVAFVTESSIRFKHSVKKLTSEFDPHKLLELIPKQFVYNDDIPLEFDDMKGKTLPGFIAEDVDKIYPSAVIHDKDGNVESWDVRRIVPGMLALIQEQDKKIKDLESRLEKLENLLLERSK